MQTKTQHIYFVRHGESDANKKGVYSPLDAELTPEGAKQAHAIVDQCDLLPIDVVITSDLKRAVETARIVNEGIGVDIVETDLLREQGRPREVVGKPKSDPGVKKITDAMREHASDPSWHHSNEENYTEFRGRLVSALADIIARPERHVLVVTHSAAMKMIMSIIIHGPEVAPEMYYHLHHVLTTQNTGITLARFGGTWELVTWNNFTHLHEHFHEHKAEQ